MENVGKWMSVWDRALRKAAYVPLSQRIRSERNLKCGVCKFLFGSSKCMCGPFVWKGKIVHMCMCRLLVRRCKIVWLWTFCVVVQNICRLLVWKWKMFFTGDDFKCLQQPNKCVLERFYVLTNNPNFLLFLDVLCVNCITWLVISVVYLDFIL